MYDIKSKTKKKSGLPKKKKKAIKDAVMNKLIGNRKVSMWSQCLLSYQPNLNLKGKPEKVKW